MNWYTKVKYNCKQTTYLIEKREEAHLTFRETSEMYIHLFNCTWCRLYRSQSIMIGKMVKRHFKVEGKDVIPMNNATKIQLQELIENKLNKNE